METVQQLSAQIAALTKKLAEQEAKISKANLTQFELTADQIIRNFNEIPAFSGEDSYKLKSFLKTVEDVEALCGENNNKLKQYCLKKLINSKIIGKAKDAILEIPELRRNWTTVVETLMLRFRPKKTIHQLLFYAKELKIFNLKDLFNKLSSVKADASEICDFENKDSFSYESIDSELVQILKSKLIPILQMQIDGTKSLFELDNFFCQSEIYFSEEVIKYMYRINKSQKHDRKIQINKRNNSDGHVKNYPQHFYNSPNFHNPPRPSFTRNDNNCTNSNQYRRPSFTRNDNNYTNSNQYRRPNFTQKRSKQFRSGNNNNRPEPMEIDNIVTETKINQEVNFTD